MIRCEMCGDDVFDIIEHLRTIHPDAYAEGFEYWPDGKFVIVDTVLDPDDFKEKM